MLLGIDPGLDGAVAWGDGGAVLGVMRMAEWRINARAFMLVKGIDLVALEEVHSMPGQGVASMFTFGREVGWLQGVCDGMGIGVLPLRPQQWMRALGVVGKKADGYHSDQWCKDNGYQGLIVPERCRVPHSGICDAICIYHAACLRVYK